MTDLEARLDQALKADAAAARDPMFRILVMERRAQATLRGRLAASCGLALGAALLAALGLAATQALLDGSERLMAIAAMGAALTALLAAPYLGGATALRALASRASLAMRTLPRPRPWF